MEMTTKNRTQLRIVQAQDRIEKEEGRGERKKGISGTWKSWETTV